MSALAFPKTVLVVEDDLAIRETVVEILEMEGYRVLVAANGQEALTHLKAGAKPNLILLDLMMPGMDGFTFREEQLKQPEWAKLPVLVLSADGQIQDKVARMGVSSFFRKPPELEALILAVAENAS